jgi:hypothetical protein
MSTVWSGLIFSTMGVSGVRTLGRGVDVGRGVVVGLAFTMGGAVGVVVIVAAGVGVVVLVLEMGVAVGGVNTYVQNWTHDPPPSMAAVMMITVSVPSAILFMFSSAMANSSSITFIGSSRGLRLLV